MPEPIITSINVDKPILSDEEGFNIGSVNFTFDQDTVAYSVKCLGTSYNTGTNVEEGDKSISTQATNYTVAEANTISVKEFAVFPAETLISAELIYTELYQEGANRINVYGKSIDGIWSTYNQAPQKTELFVRYIRSNIYQSTDGKGQWSEIQAFSFDDRTNVALNKTVIPQVEMNLNQDLTLVTDGSTSSGFVESSTYGAIDIDLGQSYKLYEIQVNHYWDGRIYGHTLSVSSDGESWMELWNTAIDGEYPSTHDGKLIRVPQYTDGTFAS